MLTTTTAGSLWWTIKARCNLETAEHNHARTTVHARISTLLPYVR